MKTDPGLKQVAQEEQTPGSLLRQALELVGERLRVASGSAQVCIRHHRSWSSDLHPAKPTDTAPPCGAGRAMRVGCVGGTQALLH